MSNIKPGDHVGIVGMLKPGREEKSILILRIWTMSSLAEVDSHLLELVLIPLKMHRVQERRVAIAQSHYTGEVYSDFPRKGMNPSQHNPYSAPRSNTGLGTQRMIPAGDYQSYRTQDEFSGIPDAKIILKILR